MVTFLFVCLFRHSEALWYIQRDKNLEDKQVDKGVQLWIGCEYIQEEKSGKWILRYKAQGSDNVNVGIFMLNKTYIPTGFSWKK